MNADTGGLPSVATQCDREQCDRKQCGHKTCVRLRGLIMLAALAGVISGCPPIDPVTHMPSPALPLPEAARHVNQNIERITGTLRAAGTVDGRLRMADGRLRSFHVSATLFYLAPLVAERSGPFVRLDLEKLGDTQFLIGSNATRYWYYSREDDGFECAWHGGDDTLLSAFPIRPASLADALGISPIPLGPVARGAVGLVQRVERDHQQILFLSQRPRGGITLEKEYWIDRFAPHLISRVVFRDALGRTELDSQLSDYRSVTEGGPMLPHRMEASWPKSDARITFVVRKWSLVDQVRPDSIQFATPRECENR